MYKKSFESAQNSFNHVVICGSIMYRAYSFVFEDWGGNFSYQKLRNEAFVVIVEGQVENSWLLLLPLPQRSSCVSEAERRKDKWHSWPTSPQESPPPTSYVASDVAESTTTPIVKVLIIRAEDKVIWGNGWYGGEAG